MKYRIIKERHDELIIITEDGGVACIREAEPIDKDQPRIAVTDYYQDRLTEYPDINQDNVFECLAEGKMYHKDWASSPFDSKEVIQDALDWLVVGETQWEKVDDLFLNLLPE